MSGWISGFVELPPGAIKDAEGVGECAQVFFITDCQDDALEIGVADPSDEGNRNFPCIFMYAYFLHALSLKIICTKNGHRVE